MTKKISCLCLIVSFYVQSLNGEVNILCQLYVVLYLIDIVRVQQCLSSLYSIVTYGSISTGSTLNAIKKFNEFILAMISDPTTVETRILSIYDVILFVVLCKTANSDSLN